MTEHNEPRSMPGIARIVLIAGVAAMLVIVYGGPRLGVPSAIAFSVVLAMVLAVSATFGYTWPDWSEHGRKLCKSFVVTFIVLAVLSVMADVKYHRYDWILEVYFLVMVAVAPILGFITGRLTRRAMAARRA